MLTCCWDVKQPTNTTNNKSRLSDASNCVKKQIDRAHGQDSGVLQYVERRKENNVKNIDNATMLGIVKDKNQIRRLYVRCMKLEGEML